MIGNIAIKQLRNRTRSGIGVKPNGTEYNLNSVPYTDEYAKQKGSSKVDLTLSGEMLEGMHVSGVTKSGPEISVAPADYGKLRGAEEGIKTKKGLVKRPFFRLSKGDIKKITNNSLFKNTINRAYKRALSKGQT